MVEGEVEVEERGGGGGHSKTKVDQDYQPATPTPSAEIPATKTSVNLGSMRYCSCLLDNASLTKSMSRIDVIIGSSLLYNSIASLNNVGYACLTRNISGI